MDNETPDKYLQTAKQNSLNGRAESLRVRAFGRLIG
jgi:hypothetical protein